MGILDTLFGDNGKGAAKKQSKENELNREFIREGTRKARADIDRLYPGVGEARQSGFDLAKGIFANTTPQAFNAFQSGNRAAQNTVAAAPQQQYNARMGLPVDFGFLQPQEQFTPDFSFLQSPPQQAAPQEQQPPQDIESLVSNPDFLASLGINVNQFHKGPGAGGIL